MPMDMNALEAVDLFISLKNLPKMQNFSDTDAFCVVYAVDTETQQLRKFHITDCVKNSQNPVFNGSLLMNYYFESVQDITIKVYQCDLKYNPSMEDRHTLIGQGNFYLSNLMCASGNHLSVQIGGGKYAEGTIEVRGEARTNTRDEFCVTFSGNKLANKDGFFGTSDPFLIISRMNEDSTWQQTWKGNKIDNSLNPKWAAVKIPMSLLCNGDIDRPLKIDVFDWDSDGKHDSMGAVETSVRAMLSANGTGFNVIEADKKLKKRGYVNSGTLMASNCIIEHHPTFTEFISGGLQISLCVAIDFTGSNGDPMTPASLHHISPSGAFNGYQNAITAVGQCLEPYDSDHMYPVYGFGAKLRQADGQFSPVQHCFPVYGGGVEVQGISGIMQAYQQCLQNVAMSGPTIFGPLLQASTAIAMGKNCSQQNQQYMILLILTDGVINDMDATIQSIIGASTAPMSVIIVGIGNADFAGMNALDCDGKLLSSGGKIAERDIVQFVSYNDAASKGTQVLSAQVLAEVPSQVLKYMEKHKIVPNKKA